MKFSGYTIRPVREDDLPGYFRLIDTNRKRLEDFFAGTVAITKDLQQTKAHLVDILDKMEKRNYFSFVVVDDASGDLVASVQVKNLDWSIPKAEIGYYIDEKFEGKGIVSNATSRIIDYCFGELKLGKLFIRTHERNISSRRVAEKNGFLLEGTIRNDYRTTKGELVDLMYYGLTGDDYRQRQNSRP